MKKSKLIGLGLAGAAAGAGLAYFFKVKMKDEEFQKKLKHLGGDGINKVFEGIDNVLPKLPWPYIEDYVSEHFYEGHDAFRDTSVRGSKWSLGYARASLLPIDYTAKNYYLGGFLTNPPSTVKSILDDQAVRVICVDDGSGRGAAVFAVIDCVGIASGDVRAIRAMLKKFAKENNIVSINVSATHNHSSVDTLGLWGPLPDILKNNIREIKKGNLENLISGRDPEFMDNLHETAAQAIKDAFASMKKGRMFSKTITDVKYSHDKRPPRIVDEAMTKLHFIPDDGSAPTVAAFMAAHPVALEPKDGELSGDYIYYMEQEVNAAGANFIFFQGAQLAVTTDRGAVIPEGAEGRGFMEYGKAIARILMSYDETQEDKVLPILNVRNTEVFVPGGNFILLATAKAGVVNNTVVKTGEKARDLMFVTEVGYAEFGKLLAFVMMPGEVAPELLVGGTLSAEDACTGTAWTFPSMREMAGNRHLTVIGLANDCVGYILPDNDFGCILEDKRYEESVSPGPKTGSTLVGAFRELLYSADRLAADDAE